MVLRLNHNTRPPSGKYMVGAGPFFASSRAGRVHGAGGDRPLPEKHHFVTATMGWPRTL